MYTNAGSSTSSLYLDTPIPNNFILDRYQLQLGGGFQGNISDFKISNYPTNTEDVRQNLFGLQHQYRPQNFLDLGLIGTFAPNSDSYSLQIDRTLLDPTYSIFNVIDIDTSGNFQWDNLILKSQIAVKIL